MIVSQNFTQVQQQLTEIINMLCDYMISKGITETAQMDTLKQKVKDIKSESDIDDLENLLSGLKL